MTKTARGLRDSRTGDSRLGKINWVIKEQNEAAVMQEPLTIDSRSAFAILRKSAGRNGRDYANALRSRRGYKRIWMRAIAGSLMASLIISARGGRARDFNMQGMIENASRINTSTWASGEDDKDKGRADIWGWKRPRLIPRISLNSIFPRKRPTC